MRGEGTLSTNGRRIALALLGAVAVLSALALARPDAGRRAWQRVYPMLPARLQALPYALESRFTPRDATPLPLPTAAAAPPSAATLEPLAAATATEPPAAGAPAGRPRPSATGEPAPTAKAPVTAVPAASPPPRAALPPIRHEYQTWNNCGPATVSMALSAFGDGGDQRAAALRLKPEPDDKNVSPDELARYARERGYMADLIHGGDIALLQRLLAAGAAVIVEFWFVPEPDDEMGHYRLLTGYDAAARTFNAADSYNGPDLIIHWDAFDADWRVFNRTLVAIYPEALRGPVAEALGPRDAPEAMWLMAASAARTEVEAAKDGFSWFNLGTSLLAMGDAQAAAEAYDRARALGLPWRMLWYQFGPFEAYAAVGRWDDVAALAESTLHNVGDLEESLYWRGRARQARGDAVGARADWERAVLLNPLWEAPRAALTEISAP